MFTLGLSTCHKFSSYRFWAKFLYIKWLHKVILNFPLSETWFCTMYRGKLLVPGLTTRDFVHCWWFLLEFMQLVCQSVPCILLALITGHRFGFQIPGSMEICLIGPVTDLNCSRVEFSQDWDWDSFTCIVIAVHELNNSNSFVKTHLKIAFRIVLIYCNARGTYKTVQTLPLSRPNKECYVMNLVS